MARSRARGSAAGGDRDSDLLERAHELAALDELLDAATHGEPGVGIVEGPAGIGKTRLVAEAKRRAAARGWLVLSAVGTELEQGYGFGVAAQLFAPVVRAKPELLAGADAARAVLDPAYRADADDHSDLSFASLHALYVLTDRLCQEGPVVLAVDDLQWCDAPSMRALAYLRARLDHLCVVLICSLRPVTPDPGSAATEAIVSHAATVRLRPRSLSTEATATLLGRGLGAQPDAEFAAACHRATGGNPLLLNELLDVLAAEEISPDLTSLPRLADLGPASVPRRVLLRLRRLGREATNLAHALAVLGDGADLGGLASLADLDLDEAADAAARLTEASILRREPPIGFVHPVVGEAVLRDVLPGRRDLLHGRAAALLTEIGAAPERIAQHLVRAPATGNAQSVEQLVVAAEDATRKGAADEATAYLRRALEEPPPPDRRATVLLALGRTELLGNGADAADHLRAAYDLLTDPHQRADAGQLLARALLFTGHGDEAVRMLQEAAAALPLELQDDRDSLVAYELFCAFFFGVGGSDARARIEGYRQQAHPKGTGACMLAAIAAQDWMYECGSSTAVSDLALASLATGELIEADTGWAASFPMTVLTFADRPEAEAWWERVMDEALRRGSLLHITSVELFRALALRRRGELVDAGHHLSNASSALREWGYHERVAAIFNDAHTASLLRERGDLAGARRALGARPEAGREDEGARQWFGSELELLVAEGEHEAATTAADAYADAFAGTVPNPMDVPWRSLKATALDRSGRPDEALELLWAELELARSWGAPGTVARTLRTLGTVERRRGITHLEEAVAVTAGTPARLEHARSVAALGAALRRWRQPTAARAHLREALQLATTFGADLLAAEVRAELLAAGGRPRRAAITGVDSLTASERRVALLAAEGRTNREIGEVLFVTPKTVAMHLSNTYRKLGVASRRELSKSIPADR